MLHQHFRSIRSICESLWKYLSIEPYDENECGLQLLSSYYLLDIKVNSIEIEYIPNDFLLGVAGLSCYQCSMKYSNAECNSNNSTYSTECQPTYDTCLTIVLKPGRIEFTLIYFIRPI
jgi:hypothetical protein